MEALKYLPEDPEHGHGHTLSLVRTLSAAILLCLAPTPCSAQAVDTERPVPILTGNAGIFTNVNAGQAQLVPEINPVVLMPMGSRWLIEARGEFKGEFERPAGGGSYGGREENEPDYLYADYIANPYFSFNARRFLSTFCHFNERLYPMLNCHLLPTPFIFPVETG